MTKKLWGGRFKKGIDARLQEFSYSLISDSRLLNSEIAVNLAYVKVLRKAKLLTVAEATKLKKGLLAIEKSWKPEKACSLHSEYEDIHGYLQSELERRVGSVGKKIHTGRSRNDLVVTSTRVYLREAAKELLSGMLKVQKSLLSLSKKAGDKIIPGLTHLKKAQPVLAAHHLLAYVEMIEEDKDRLQVAVNRMNVLPLGSAALGGSSLPLDRKLLAKELKFDRVSTNSMASVSDRAFLVDYVGALATFWMHLSRLSEDFIFWNTEAVEFIELDDSFATGSSLMPQKKNPDVFELLRGRSSKVISELNHLLVLQKGLSLTYNRDLQEDKPGVFKVIDQTLLATEVLAPTVQTAKWNAKAMAESLLDDGLYATDLLEYLVRKGLAFSDAHSLVGKIVRFGKDEDVALSTMPVKQWKKFSNKFDKDITRLFSAKVSVDSKKTIGSTKTTLVKNNIKAWDRKLK